QTHASVADTALPCLCEVAEIPGSGEATRVSKDIRSVTEAEQRHRDDREDHQRAPDKQEGVAHPPPRRTFAETFQCPRARHPDGRSGMRLSHRGVQTHLHYSELLRMPRRPMRPTTRRPIVPSRAAAEAAPYPPCSKAVR